MALTKQSININFAQGLDTKTDPWQVASGKFLALQNSVFTKGGLLAKRNGYKALTSLPDNTYRHVTTFNGNLTAIGTNLTALSQGSSQWINTGAIRPMDLEVEPLVRSNTNQVQADSAVSSNNLVCTVYNDVNAGVSTIKYTITDYMTGQVVVPATVISDAINSPRVFTLGRYFIIVFGAVVSATDHLQYIAISITNPGVPGVATDISTQYSSASTCPFDGVVANNSLYISWNGSDSGGAVRSTLIDSQLVQHNTVVGPGSSGTTADYVSLSADTSASTPVVWTYYSAGTDSYAYALDQDLNTVLSAVQVSSTGTKVNITSVADAGILTLFYEIANNYGYDASIPTHFIRTNTLVQDGTLGTSAILARSVGLASKAFMIGDVPYFLAVYSSANQPTYFALNGLTGGVVSKIAYSNGTANLTTSGGYLPYNLPSAVVQADGMSVAIAYLYKDLLTSVNSQQVAATSATTPAGIITQISDSAAIYSQTGINLATMDFDTQKVLTSELGQNLNISGGIMWAYDGSTPVEQGFNLWPDYVETTPSASSGGMLAQQYFYQALYEWSDAQGNIFRSAPSIPVSAKTVAGTGINFTSVFSTGASSITVSSVTGLFVGQVITDTTTPGNIQAGTTITSIVGTTVGLSLPTAGNSASSPGDTLHTVQQASVTVHVPTLRLTYKTATPVKIVLYRWSTAQQNYFQVTSITSPVLNDPTVDYITYVDTKSDQAILGNSLIYTTGGVVEDIGAPPTSTMTLYRSRLFAVDAENRNLIWYSKQVIEGTPVEMSDLFTIYVAPTIGAQGNTGPISALSAMDDKLIIFKRDAIYYITGNGPDNTGLNDDFSDPVFITSTVGCTNQNSIVFMPDGLMFQSDKGIWLLGRDLSTKYIGDAVEEFNDGIVESALSIPGQNQVRFTLDSGITLMYDYYYSQWGTFFNIPALASTLYQNLHTYINVFGQVFQETPDLYLDGTNPINMNFMTNWIKLDQLQSYQRAHEFFILGQYLTPHRLQLQIEYDYQTGPTQTTIITPTNFSPPYGFGAQQSPYGQGSPYGGSTSVEQWRVFLDRQRCSAFRITLQEIYDPSKGIPAGAGLTLSGLNIIASFKKNFRTIRSAHSAGGGSI